MLARRYGGFLDSAGESAFTLDVELTDPPETPRDEDIQVTQDAGVWTIRRGDFCAQLDLTARRGWIRQSANPYSADALLRILHTLLLAPEGGFLLHASSAVRNGQAFLFAGVSGSGKTTIARLAPPGVILLTDEISYLRRDPSGYRAFGTPFAGELGVVGENVSAPVEALYFLAHGQENRVEPLAVADAARALLRNILFFSEEPVLVRQVFEGACAFASTIRAAKLTFAPDRSVWELVE